MLTMDDEYIRKQAARLLGGDQTVINDLIEKHIQLTRNIAISFFKSRERQKDDIVSVAFFALTKAVNDAEDALHNDNITPYICTIVKNSIKKFLIRDRLVPIPSTTLSRIKTKNPNFSIPSVISLEENSRHNEKSDRLPIEYINKLVVYDLHPEEVFEDFCVSLHLDILESKVLKYKTSGLTEKEIAEILNFSQPYISQIMKSIRGKYENFT